MAYRDDVDSVRKIVQRDALLRDVAELEAQCREAEAEADESRSRDWHARTSSIVGGFVGFFAGMACFAALSVIWTAAR